MGDFWFDFSWVGQSWNFDPNVNFWENAMSNFHATFKIKFSDLIYIYLDTKIIAKCQKKEQLKVLYSNLLPPLKYGMVTQEGAAVFS